MTALFEKLVDAKDPEKALRKAAPKGKAAAALWEVAAAGLVPFADRGWCDAHSDLLDLFAATAGEVPSATVNTALASVAPARILSSSIFNMIARNDAARAVEWDAIFETLPPLPRSVIAIRRAGERKPIPNELREQLLEMFAHGVATDDDADDSRAVGYAATLGEDGEAWERRVLRHVLAHGIDAVPHREAIARALVHAPWETVRAYFERFPTSGFLTDVLGTGAYPALAIWELMAAAGDTTDRDFMGMLVPLAARQGVTLPAAADASIYAYIDNGGDAPAFYRALAQLPVERVRAIAARLREEESRFALRVWHLAGDPEIEAELLERLRTELGEPDEWEARELVEVIAAGGERARVLFATVRRELDGGDKLSARRRLLLRSGIVRSYLMEGSTPPVDALLPDDDLPFLDSLNDLFPSEGFEAVLAGLPAGDRARVADVWARLDWDGALDAAAYFDGEHEDPDIEAMPWATLAELFAQTSFTRLDHCAQHVFTVFERDEPVARRVALAQTLLDRPREGDTDFPDVFENIVYALCPALADAGQGLPASWEDVVVARARDSALGDGTVQQLAKLPASWLRPLVERLLADEGEAPGNGERLRDEAGWSDDEDEGDDAHAEDPVARVRRLAAACGQPLTERIYALVRVDEPTATPRRTAARPLGLAAEDWPSVDGEPMEHVLTLDLAAMPELRARGDFGADVAAVAVFISNRADNEAYTAGSGLIEIVPLDGEQLAAGHAEEGASYEVVALDVPEGLFGDDAALGELRTAVRRLEARALGAPMFIQSQEDGADDFLVQLSDAFVPGLNCGDGELYVFGSDGWWEN